ncbi:hypothetical protein [Cohnella sp. WQ 127256]|uniref:hypothetical protein n=1 Tax=Cohnella sp. WQ 127256 TaxID=2938790 RepID=UPI00211938C4|nr:hypothetical protein [Cohnella sp. WQ 127256]
MDPFRLERKQPTTDLATVESQRNELLPEEFPEGPYGSDIVAVNLGKSESWRDDQKPKSAFAYENHELHAGLDRGYPGDYDAHSENDEADLK